MKKHISAEMALHEVREVAENWIADAHGVSRDNVTLVVTDGNNLPSMPFSLDAPMPQKAIIEMMNGNKIGAIKETRAYYGWGLKESKDFVEAFDIKLRRTSVFRY